MVGAGPAFNAILFILLVPSFFAVQFPDIFNGVKPVPLAPLMALANGCFLLMSLLPYRAKYDGVKLQTDGLRLLNLLFNRQPEAATLAASDGHNAHPNLAPSWLWRLRHSKPEPFLREVETHLNNPNLPNEARCQFLDLYATGVLMFGAKDFLPEADRYSVELLAAKPAEWTVKGTRGSILVDLGKIEAGMAMLQNVMKNDPSEFDRAICASFLALGEIKQGHFSKAAEWIQFARRLDSNCAALHRIEPLLRCRGVDG
jgi:hypothetical protein